MIDYELAGVQVTLHFPASPVMARDRLLTVFVSLYADPMPQQLERAATWMKWPKRWFAVVWVFRYLFFFFSFFFFSFFFFFIMLVGYLKNGSVNKFFFLS